MESFRFGERTMNRLTDIKELHDAVLHLQLSYGEKPKEFKRNKDKSIQMVLNY
jgi:hypothetical protein